MTIAGLVEKPQTPSIASEAERSCLLSGIPWGTDVDISHRETLQTVIDHAESDDRVDSLVVPIGKGLLVCRKI
ncbi:MAG: hypothetical protein KKG33_12620 [candidate division Zixibacteria bacterium]|nr:hypothetical protein [candidate division Zixibacteria bacterium]MBU1469335.1 hypothetical protein [candidate division Zixibacteria bacterium]MBU2626395.1 hypothetical protein [candidate division Zixibacteria bacterium]